RGRRPRRGAGGFCCVRRPSPAISGHGPSCCARPGRACSAPPPRSAPASNGCPASSPRWPPESEDAERRRVLGGRPRASFLVCSQIDCRPPARKGDPHLLNPPAPCPRGGRARRGFSCQAPRHKRRRHAKRSGSHLLSVSPRATAWRAQDGGNKKMRIAQIAPLIESVPPRLYGGTERIVAYLTEELVRQGHEVTLFASGDSLTSAELVPC